MGDATIRVYFPPESTQTRATLDAIVQAVPAANAVFAQANEIKMMLALVNRVSATEPTGDPSNAAVAAKIEIYQQAQKGGVVGFGAFKSGDTPTDFAPERVLWPREDPKIMVRVHHKFVVVDAEGDNPVMFTGSANFSGNSLHKNDENLLEITHCPRLAGIYLAEFLRLYEHYRARAAFAKRVQGDSKSFILTPNNDWTKKYFTDSAESRARVAMAGA